MANWLCEGTIMLFGLALYRCCLRNWQPHTVMFLLIVSRTLCPITVVQGRNKQLACIRSTYSLNMHLPAYDLPRGGCWRMKAPLNRRMTPIPPHRAVIRGRRDGCNQSEPPLPPSVTIPPMENEDKCCCGWGSGCSFMSPWNCDRDIYPPVPPHGPD